MRRERQPGTYTWCQRQRRKLRLRLDCMGRDVCWWFFRCKSSKHWW